jgi:hypothetical protein
MRVLVPYVRLSNATVAAVHAAGADVAFVETPGPTGYWQALADMWGRRRAVIVLEQDKVPEPGLLAKLWACPSDWCVVNAPMRDSSERAPYPSLSCVKFSGSLMAAYPDLLGCAGELDLGFGEKEWSRLDMVVAGLLGGRGWEPHYHEGVVQHLHEPRAA